MLAVALQTPEHRCKPRGTIVNPQSGPGDITTNNWSSIANPRAPLQDPWAALQACCVQPLSCSVAAGDHSPALLALSCSSSTGSWHAVTDPSPPACRSGPQ